MYEVTIRNLPFGQAQALYRFLVNLQDEEPMHGGEGMSWEGGVPGKRVVDDSEPVQRTVTISPMKEGE